MVGRSGRAPPHRISRETEPPMKKLAFGFLAAGFAVTAACSASTAKPIPQSGKIDQTTATTSSPTPTTKAEVTTTTVTTTKVSSCDAVREALLTGTQAQINAAMGLLQVDRAADATAREYADYYLHRDATDPSMRTADVGLIRMSCS